MKNVVTSVKYPVKGTLRCGGSGPKPLPCVTGMSPARDPLPSSSGTATVGVQGQGGFHRYPGAEPTFRYKYCVLITQDKKDRPKHRTAAINKAVACLWY